MRFKGTLLAPLVQKSEKENLDIQALKSHIISYN
jgi:hypothetical protein